MQQKQLHRALPGTCTVKRFNGEAFLQIRQLGQDFDVIRLVSLH